VLLGGTSNHFRREVLEATGGWDPYNVTEDADLGIPLARAGWQVEVLPSTTWEEAPACFGVWIGQRTRWLKGWMQTCLVHLRRPAVLRRELGTCAFLGFNILMGGLIVSALIHPIFYAVAAWSLWTGSGHLAMPEEGSWRAAIWGLGGGQSVARLWARHGARLGGDAAAARYGARVARRLYSGLLAFDLTCRLSGAVRTRPGALLLGEDGAQRPPAERVTPERGSDV